jgi:hypothetical protein
MSHEIKGTYKKDRNNNDKNIFQEKISKEIQSKWKKELERQKTIGKDNVEVWLVPLVNAEE